MYVSNCLFAFSSLPAFVQNFNGRSYSQLYASFLTDLIEPTVEITYLPTYFKGKEIKIIW